MRWEYTQPKLVLRIGAMFLMVAIFPIKVVQADVKGPGSFGFNLNYAPGAGDTSDTLDDGWGFGMDLGYRKESSLLGVRLDLVHNSFEFSDSALNQYYLVNDGFVSVWGIDASVVLAPPNADKIRPYIQFGPGFYYEYAEAYRVTNNGPVVCDPWFGCYETGTAQSIEEETTWRLGWVGGFGLNIENARGGALFLQVQYHLVNNSKRDLEFVPISIGYRQSF
ncbi:MAG: hypothetical protein KCHDKBKB_01288 [Elusimicrobia bacterium]|nr:hypothetical protein [Elusimicrobiota bacterium]